MPSSATAFSTIFTLPKCSGEPSIDTPSPGHRYSSGDEPEVLKKDFYNSLLAAFEPKEIQDQLEETGLGHLSIRQISDRHITISGYR
jgi:hypothetical protein